jgi:hypothetical protein
MPDTVSQKEDLSVRESKGKSVKANKRARSILIVSLILVVGIIAVVLWRSGATPRGEAIAKIVGDDKNPDKNPGLLSNEQKPLGSIILANYEEYRDNTIRWSAAYFSCLFLSAAFSALAGFVLKIKAFSTASVLKEDLAALLAMLAALLITLSTVGDFQRKWQANRIAASDTEALAYDLIKTPFGEVERAKVISSLQEISANRNREIVGDRSGPNAQPGQKGNDNKSADNLNRNSNVNRNSTSNRNSNANTNTNLNANRP